MNFFFWYMECWGSFSGYHEGGRRGWCSKSCSSPFSKYSFGFGPSLKFSILSLDFIIFNFFPHTWILFHFVVPQALQSPNGCSEKIQKWVAWQIQATWKISSSNLRLVQYQHHHCQDKSTLQGQLLIQEEQKSKIVSFLAFCCFTLGSSTDAWFLPWGLIYRCRQRQAAALMPVRTKSMDFSLWKKKKPQKNPFTSLLVNNQHIIFSHLSTSKNLKKKFLSNPIMLWISFQDKN